MPIGLTKFIFSLIIAYVLFSELPTQFHQWFGVTLIFLSTALLYYFQINPSKLKN